MLSLLIQGNLVADACDRKSSGGKAFATANVRVPTEGADSALISVIAFGSEAMAALLTLRKGDSVAVCGRGKLTVWARDGESRQGISLVADRVMTIYQATSVRKAAREAIEP